MIKPSSCPCTPENIYDTCCKPYHYGALAKHAETLMRARYSAFALQRIEFIKNSSLPAQQDLLDMEAIGQWSQNSQWLGLEVLAATLSDSQRHATVEFIAHWQDAQGRHQHREKSLFIKPDEQWYFYDPNVPLLAQRNAACPCGSGVKFKKCCAPFF
ncbi:MAG TPA: YchJ family protein [Thiopseudomonas sp.]|nr:YchJ family protein [Thiopseudomonas sp.]